LSGAADATHERSLHTGQNDAAEKDAVSPQARPAVGVQQREWQASDPLARPYIGDAGIRMEVSGAAFLPVCAWALREPCETGTVFHPQSKSEIVGERLKMTMKWQPGNTAPKDGSPFWGWLSDSGIRLMEYRTAAENAAQDDSADVDRYQAAFVEVSDPTEAWEPRFWLPYSAITTPN
jgi:hypothetical protein